MQIEETPLPGVFVITPARHGDARGFFSESWNARRMREAGLHYDFVQDNQSFSKKGVIRALHYQLGDYAQAKLVRVLQGKVLDVSVDLRPGSETFGNHVAVELSHENRRQLFIPKGFAHGFIVLSQTAEFFYKCDNYYNPESEGGIIYNDPDLGIDWKLSETEMILSEKDATLPRLKDARI